MEIDIITTFMTLVECKSFTTAANILNISQSALSHRLSLLENELGETLIVRGRGKREFYLTEAGLDFIPLAQRWMSLSKNIKNFKTNRRIHNITVGTVESYAHLFGNLCNSITLASKKDYPLLFSYYTYPSFHIINEVERQNIDIGFAVRQRTSRNLKIEPIFSEDHYLVGDLGSDKKIIDPRTLDPNKEILTDWSPSYRSWHDLYFGSDNYSFAVAGTSVALPEFLSKDTWCIVPKSFTLYLQEINKLKGITTQIYEMPDVPPKRICYQVTQRAPSANKLTILHYFTDKVQLFLKENDLHL
jgi:DNA-binding transcriptional LysR family regulator